MRGAPGERASPFSLRPQNVSTNKTPGRSDTLPDNAPARLDAALSLLRLDLDATQRQQLLDHLRLLMRWNAVYNLTAVRDPRHMLEQHLFDCLAIIPPLRDPARAGRDHLAPGAVVMDVGSGGGLPGVVIAICAPQVQVHCVDAVAKKVAFLTQCRAELGLPNLHAHHARVEQLRITPVSLAVSRAFASLADFIHLTEALMAPDACWAAMKGVLPQDELAALPASVRLASTITLAVPELDAQRHLLLLARAPRPPGN